MKEKTVSNCYLVAVVITRKRFSQQEQTGKSAYFDSSSV